MRKTASIAVLAILLIGLLVWIAPELASPGRGSGQINDGWSTTEETTTGHEDTTTATTSPQPSSLDGVLLVYDGEALTELLWRNMRDYNTSDPAIHPYLKWLSNALSRSPPAVARALAPEQRYEEYRYDEGRGVGLVVGRDGLPDWWVDGGGFARTEIPGPLGSHTVRMGIIKLPFGAGLIVTAYYDDTGGLIVVVHATVLDTEEYFEEIGRRSAPSLGYCELGSVVLYRGIVPVRGSPSLSTPGGEELPVERVVVLVETPVFMGLSGSWRADPYALWVPYIVLARPAYGLALHFALGEGVDPLDVYGVFVLEVTENVVRFGSYYIDSDPILRQRGLPPFGTILSLRVNGGLCYDYSIASLLFASYILGAIGDSHGGEDHQFSLLIFPSSIYETNLSPGYSEAGDGGPGDGPVSLPFDIDNDSINDMAYVLDNIAPNLFDLERINRIVNTYLRPLCDLYSYEDYIIIYGDGWGGYLWRNTGSLTWTGIMYYYGIIDYVRGLPGWLQPPWHPTFQQEIYDKQNHTGPLTVPVEVLDSALNHYVKFDVCTKENNLSHTMLAPASPVQGLLGAVPVVDSGVVPTMPMVRMRSPDWGGAYLSHGIKVPVPVWANETVVELEPVYDDLGQLRRLRGTAWAGGHNVSVVAKYGGGEYSYWVYVDGDPARIDAVGAGWIAAVHAPPDTPFGTLYNITLVYPEPPRLDAGLTVQGDVYMYGTVRLANGSTVKIPYYHTGQEESIGGVRVVVEGTYSRVHISVWVRVYYIPPYEYNVTVTGPEGVEAEYSMGGYLRVRLEYEAPRSDDGVTGLLPPGTTITVTIQELNLTITLTIPG